MPDLPTLNHATAIVIPAQAGILFDARKFLKKQIIG